VLAALVELDGAYTYYPTYAQVLTEYNRRNFKPVFMVEANYEFEHNAYTDGGSTANLRRQEYWTMLSGATGQLYGSKYTWALPTGWFSSWRSHLDTPGVTQLGYMKNLFARLRWYDLVPDQIHTVVTDGYGTPAPLGSGSVATDTYATAARAPDGRVVIVYVPTIRPITVDMSKLSGPTAARWYDPALASISRWAARYSQTRAARSSRRRARTTIATGTGYLSSKQAKRRSSCGWRSWKPATPKRSAGSPPRSGRCRYARGTKEAQQAAISFLAKRSCTTGVQ